MTQLICISLNSLCHIQCQGARLESKINQFHILLTHNTPIGGQTRIWPSSLDHVTSIHLTVRHKPRQNRHPGKSSRFPDQTLGVKQRRWAWITKVGEIRLTGNLDATFLNQSLSEWQHFQDHPIKKMTLPPRPHSTFSLNRNSSSSNH